MWRTLFMAIGITLLILGVECLVVEKAIFADEFLNKPRPQTAYTFAPAAPERSFTPPEWAPWSLLSAGAIILLYSVTLRRTAPE